MAIIVRRIPERLTWADYLLIPIVINPHDSTQRDAFTAFSFDIPEKPPKTVDGQLALAETFEITIRPHARAKRGGSQTTELLAHEQFHYDVGFVVARVVARELMTLRAGDEPELATAVWNTVRLHFFFRAELIQRRYDLDTRHGTVRYDQQVWFSRMSRCLADPASSQIGGFWLLMFAKVRWIERDARHSTTAKSTGNTINFFVLVLSRARRRPLPRTMKSRLTIPREEAFDSPVFAFEFFRNRSRTSTRMNEMEDCSLASKRLNFDSLGRGYVQLTRRKNYESMNTRFGSHPFSRKGC